MNTSTLVQKLWNYCNGPGLGRSLARSPAREHAGACPKCRLTLRNDGMSDGACARLRLLSRDGDALFDHALDLKSGTGQYLTLRAPIRAAP